MASQPYHKDINKYKYINKRSEKIMPRKDSNSVRGRLRLMEVGEVMEIPRTESAELTVRTTASNLKACYQGRNYKVSRTQSGVAVERTS